MKIIKKIRTCSRCEYTYLGESKSCPKCDFGSFSAYFVYDSWYQVFKNLFFNTAYNFRKYPEKYSDRDSDVTSSLKGLARIMNVEDKQVRITKNK